MALRDPLPPQDVFYGLHRANMTTRLTTRNWTTNAVIRIHRLGWLYCWIRRLTQKAKPGELTVLYQVRVVGAREYGHGYDEPFVTLGRALDYANGEDAGRLARESVFATPAEYPADQPAITFVAASRQE